MARKPSPTLTDAELRPMEVLWEKGPSTVAEVVNALPQKLGLSYSTVLTTIRILEQKGYVKHTKERQAFVYHPIIDRRRLRLQEHIACDDWTLLGANDPHNYANLLTRLSAKHRREPLLASGVSR